jgi:cytochrome c biogenesis protein CcmG/thiol:disulfide interchange protein DsbE
VRMPTLYDRDRTLIAALGRSTLPVTVFVDATGHGVVHPLPLDEAGLVRMVGTTTGVAVAP